MIDLTDSWKSLNWAFFYWLSSPGQVVATSLPLILLAFWPKSSMLTKRLGKGLGFLIGLYLLLATPPIANVLVSGMVAFTPEPPDQSADYIVVLGRPHVGLETVRYDLAIQLWQENYAPQIFVSSFWATVRRFKEKGLPLEALQGTFCARTTYEEAVSAATLLQSGDDTSIILITDPPHMLRAKLTFEALGFKVYPKFSPFSPQFSALDKSTLVIRESMGLINYALLGRFNPQSVESANATLQNRISVERCLLDHNTRFDKARFEKS